MTVSKLISILQGQYEDDQVQIILKEKTRKTKLKFSRIQCDDENKSIAIILNINNQ